MKKWGDLDTKRCSTTMTILSGHWVLEKMAGIPIAWQWCSLSQYKRWWMHHVTSWGKKWDSGCCLQPVFPLPEHETAERNDKPLKSWIVSVALPSPLGFDSMLCCSSVSQSLPTWCSAHDSAVFGSTWPGSAWLGLLLLHCLWLLLAPVPVVHALC